MLFASGCLFHDCLRPGVCLVDLVSVCDRVEIYEVHVLYLSKFIWIISHIVWPICRSVRGRHNRTVNPVRALVFLGRAPCSVDPYLLGSSCELRVRAQNRPLMSCNRKISRVTFYITFSNRARVLRMISSDLAA